MMMLTTLTTKTTKKPLIHNPAAIAFTSPKPQPLLQSIANVVDDDDDDFLMMLPTMMTMMPMTMTTKNTKGPRKQ